MAHEEKRKTPVSERALRIGAAVLALLVWQAAAMLADNPLLLVTPLAALGKLFALVRTAEFWRALGSSLLRIGGGFLLGLIVSAALAALSARFRAVEILLRPYVAVVQSVPVASFIVIALLWFSARRIGFFISFLMVFPVLYTNILQGLRAEDKKLLEMAQVFRMKRRERIRSITIPALRPYLLAGEKTALGLCWKAGVAAEVISMARDTIGGRLYDAKVYLEIAELFAWTVVIVLVSAIFSRLVLAMTKWLLRKWEGS